MRIKGIVALGAALAGCAGLASMAVVQPTDMNCPAILAEVGANNERVKQLGADRGLQTTQNGAANIAGMFVPFMWFTDFQDTADTEITALQGRRRYLLMIADRNDALPI